MCVAFTCGARGETRFADSCNRSRAYRTVLDASVLPEVALGLILGTTSAELFIPVAAETGPVARVTEKLICLEQSPFENTCIASVKTEPCRFEPERM